MGNIQYFHHLSFYGIGKENCLTLRICFFSKQILTTHTLQVKVSKKVFDYSDQNQDPDDTAEVEKSGRSEMFVFNLDFGQN